MERKKKSNKTGATVSAWSIKDEIAKKQESPEFAKIWEENRAEYDLISDLISIRKQKRLTQTELASMIGYKQQVISRLEKKDNSPTLKVFCKVLGALGYELRIVKKK